MRKKWYFIACIFISLHYYCKSAFNNNPANRVTITPNPSKSDINIINAVLHNRLEEVENALKNGISVHTQDSEKRSLLLLTTRAEFVKMAQLLVKYGADVNKQDVIFDSPFLYAGATGQTVLVQLLLKNGARFNVFNRYNGTALIPACERGHVATVRLLANTPGFPINHINRLGWTALMEAVLLGDGSARYTEIVSILIKAGCNTTIPDKNGISALKQAQKNNRLCHLRRDNTLFNFKSEF